MQANNFSTKKTVTVSRLFILAGICIVPSIAQAMDLVMPEASDTGNYSISWTKAKGGTGSADVVVDEMINGKYETIYSYNNGPSANTYNVKDKAPGSYHYRITECVDSDCNPPIEKTVVVTAPKS